MNSQPLAQNCPLKPAVCLRHRDNSLLILTGSFLDVTGNGFCGTGKVNELDDVVGKSRALFSYRRKLPLNPPSRILMIYQLCIFDLYRSARSILVCEN